MSLHMEITGSSQDMTAAEMDSCAEYIKSRVDRWNVHANGSRWNTFDTAVLSLCVATLAENAARIAPVQARIL